MFKPDEFKVQLGDFDTQVDLAFRMGEGEQQIRWGCRLTPDQARALGSALLFMANKASCQHSLTILEGVLDLKMEQTCVECGERFFIGAPEHAPDFVIGQNVEIKRI